MATNSGTIISDKGNTWRPPQWSKPAMISIVVPPKYNTTPVEASADGAYVLKSSVTAQSTYVFDAVLRVEHEQRLTATRHPVQTGAAISSHAYIEPAEVTMYIGMSDAMQQYAAGHDPAESPYVQPWSGFGSKSVSAYNTVLAWQQNRVLLNVYTRLRSYMNMLVMSVSPEEEARTIKGLRMRVTFGQVLMAAISPYIISARKQTTASTGLGSVNAQTPNPTTVTQYSAPASGQRTVKTPGAGTFSSALNTLLGTGTPIVP